MTRPTVGILTLGCKVNQYESEAIAEAFTAAGLTVCSPELPCDVYVINTCTVTAESDRKAGQLIRRVHAQNEHALILVTGCFAQADPAAVAALPHVDYICGNTQKLAVVDAALKLLASGKQCSPILAVDDVARAPFEPMCITRFDRTRAYVKIEDGCENRCTYCAIPGARGRVRSKPLAEVVREVEGLVRGGCREVVLTGIETASFGRDLGCTLADLLEAVDGIEGLERVRLGSLEPTVMKPDFVARIAKLRTVTPHFHLSMQSGSARVLAAMKRRYNPVQAMEGIKRLREAIPSVELTTDFIVGFPGESEEDFLATMDFAREAAFLQMHVFTYSKRPGTPAATLGGQIPKAIKKARSAALISLGLSLRDARLTGALATPCREVLFESFEQGYAIGHTKEFFEVCVPSDHPLSGEMHTVVLHKVQDHRLHAELKG